MATSTAHVFDWVAEGIIDDTQARAIIAHEQQRAPGSRTSFVVEALIYLGAALAVLAVTAIVGDSWRDLGTAGQLAVIGVVGGAFLVIGAALRRRPTPVLTRLTSVLWALATGLIAGWVGMFSDRVAGLDGAEVLAVAAFAGFVVALVLYGLSQRVLQQVVLAIATCGLTAAILDLLGLFERGVTALGLTWWCVGVVWLILATMGRIPPPATAFVLACVVILLAPAFLIEPFSWGEFFAVGCAIGLIVLGVFLRQLILLAFGGIGVFIYVPVALFSTFGDVIGVPVGLLITSCILIGTALLLVRLGSRFRAVSAADSQGSGVVAPSAGGNLLGSSEISPDPQNQPVR